MVKFCRIDLGSSPRWICETGQWGGTSGQRSVVALLLHWRHHPCLARPYSRLLPHEKTRIETQGQLKLPSDHCTRWELGASWHQPVKKLSSSPPESTLQESASPQSTCRLFPALCFQYSRCLLGMLAQLSGRGGLGPDLLAATAATAATAAAVACAAAPAAPPGAGYRTTPSAVSTVPPVDTDVNSLGVPPSAAPHLAAAAAALRASRSGTSTADQSRVVTSPATTASRSPTCSGELFGDDCSRAPRPHGCSHRRHGSPRRIAWCVRSSIDSLHV